MNKKRIFMWLIMQNKRLIVKPAFVIMLICIPALMFMISEFALQDSGVYKVVLCTQNSQNETARSAVERLKKSDSIILFAECDSEEAAEHMVKTGAYDAAWIFFDDIDERIAQFSTDPLKKKPLVKVIEREDDVRAKLSYERLYASIFPEISYDLFKNYMMSAPFAERLDETELMQSYENARLNDELITFGYLEGTPSEKSPDYLIAPLKGFLSVIVILCGLSAQTLYLSDKKKGMYDRIQPQKRIIAGAGITLAAIADACIALFVSLMIIGSGASLLNETVSLICFSAAVLGFCVFAGTVFRSHRLLGVCIPFLLLLILGISPVFFNMDRLRAFQMLFPPFYYLNSCYDLKYAAYALLYGTILFLLSGIIDRTVSVGKN